MGFIRRATKGGATGLVANPAALARDELRRAGADLDAPHESRHFFYVPGVKAAQQFARSLKRPERRIEIETSARKGYWLVAVIQSVVVTPENMSSLKTEFEAAAAPFAGEYDCWQVAVADD